VPAKGDRDREPCLSFFYSNSPRFGVIEDGSEPHDGLTQGIALETIAGPFCYLYDCAWEAAFGAFRKFGAGDAGPDHEILNAVALDRAASERLPLLPWTVNDDERMSRLLDS
jgi:hypothetical protein